MSLEEFWDIFFSDDAPYATDTFLEQKDINNHIKSISEWHAPKEKFKTFPFGDNSAPVMS